MERQDEVGAVAAAEYFMALYGYVRTTGDASAWGRISAQLCGFCATIALAASDVYGIGDSLVGGDVVANEGAVVSKDMGLGTFVVQLKYAVGPSTRLDGKGARVAEYPAEAGWVLLSVAPSTRGWLLLAGEYRAEPIQ